MGLTHSAVRFTDSCCFRQLDPSDESLSYCHPSAMRTCKSVKRSAIERPPPKQKVAVTFANYLSVTMKSVCRETVDFIFSSLADICST